MTNKELKELLTPEFLSTLHSAVKCCGWCVDMVETINFCDWCYNVAEQPTPEYNMSYEMEVEE
jgi:hypothetical protein